MNLAMSADGKIATADRRISQFGSRKDHAHLLELRSQADAVMCGARTADLQRVTLGTGGKKYRAKRLSAGLREHHLRVLVSRKASIHPDAEVFKHRFSPILLVTTAQADPARVRVLESKVDGIITGGEMEVDFHPVLKQLRLDWGVQRLLCEGGGELNAALFSQNLVDEVHLTVCPLIVGGRVAPTLVDGEGISRLNDATQLELVSTRNAGGEMFAVYRVRHPGPANGDVL